MELPVVIDVSLVEECAPDREAAVVEQREGDRVDDSLFGGVLVVGSKVDEHSIGFVAALAGLAQGPGKVCCGRRPEIMALDDEGVGTIE
ncbi:hypothetical protein D7223_00215 [Micromonospora endolithica]|uniref:Uncharacterized protein n=1 Tax=Micromonospora endolithica TaxID=230091 RepID=A0A3A9ZQ45_9ACTN|nr:hypothetical protein D7223_00215 [Micromonospora endolithica]